MKVKEPITDYKKLDLSESYTYLDYLKFQFKERVELFKGKVMKMSPAPSLNHQSILGNISREFSNHFYKKPCKVFQSPFDVRLFPLKSGKDKTVVQPDLCVICDPQKMGEQGCIGAPDLVLEVLSPGNTKRELDPKFDLYQEAGVREYWIVDPTSKTGLLYMLEDGKFIGLKAFVEDMFIKSAIFPALKIELEEVFYGIK